MKNMSNYLKYICIGYILSFSVSVTLNLVGAIGNNKVIVIDNLEYAIIRILIVSPILEELLFRKLLFKNILMNVFKIKLEYAAIICSVIFGIFHSPISAIVTSIFISYLLCQIYYIKGNLLYSVLLHFGFNLHSFQNSYHLIEDINTIIFIALILIVMLVKEERKKWKNNNPQ